ncbi:MAG TPA: NB-ARC domain-containing protein [Candidatus Limnocylindrales bacterium]|nr:NB-ARC domain-containing protein [Candidatus Limnocylindrales bacterium]
MAGLPQGTLTFMLSDLVASTKTWEATPVGMRDAMARHDRIVADALRRHHGHDVRSGRAGDSFLAVSRRAQDAAACALTLQREFAREPWPAGARLQIRITLHTGEAQLRAGQYYGIALARCARVLSACHGGQILMTAATQQLLADEPPPRSALRDLGFHRLKDLERPEHVYQLDDLDRPMEFPAIRSVLDAHSNLPIPLTAFIGRQDELGELRDLLEGGRLLSVIGPGGAGKTRIALQLASELTHAYPDGAWLVELGPLADPGLVPLAVAESLGLSEQPGRPIADTVVGHLRARRLLFVIDNCEHVVEAAATLVADLLARCPHLRLLATSREPLGVPGEITWRVPPLGEEASVQLFLDRARARQPRLQVGDRDRTTITRICERLDGIPLAIELAAARLPALPLDEISSRLERRFTLLTLNDRTTPTRQRTLRAAMDWSYELLTEPEKSFFRQVSIFSGRFALPAAEAIGAGASEEAVERLGALVQKSLVIMDDGRYRLLETIRAYGRERLDQVGESDAMHRRVAGYLLGLAESRVPGHLAEWLNTLEAVHDDTRATLHWAAAADPQLGMRLALALYRFWQLRGHASEPRQFAQEMLERLPAGSPMHAVGLHLAGAFAFVQGDPATAGRMVDAALQEARQAGDLQAVLRALDTRGLVSAAEGDVARSEAALKEALTLARELGERDAEAAVLHQLGLAAGRRGALPEARRLLAQSIDVKRALGCADEASMTLTFLAQASLLNGDLEDSRRCIAEALQIGLALGDRRAAFSLDVLACLNALEDHPERSLTLAAAGAAMHDASGNTPPESWTVLVSSLVQRARQTLEGQAADAAWAAGRRMTFDEALHFAIA